MMNAYGCDGCVCAVMLFVFVRVLACMRVASSVCVCLFVYAWGTMCVYVCVARCVRECLCVCAALSMCMFVFVCR